MRDEIREESIMDNRSELSNELQLAKKMNQSPLKSTNKKLDISIGKNSVVDSEIDGLIKWANNLPDDIQDHNFFMKTLNS